MGFPAEVMVRDGDANAVIYRGFLFRVVVRFICDPMKWRHGDLIQLAVVL